jgi:hypothetical protein
MPRSTCKLALLALLLAGTLAAPARAQAAPTTVTLPGPLDVRTSKLMGWLGVGIYDLGISVGDVTAHSANLAVELGLSENIYPMAKQLNLTIWASAGLAVANTDAGTYVPLSLGFGARFDQLPVQLFAGAGFVFIPHTGALDTPIGLALRFMAQVPLPFFETRRFAAQGTFTYNVLNDNFQLWTLTFGLGFAFF